MGVFGAQTLREKRFLCDYEGRRVPYADAGNVTAICDDYAFQEESTQTVIFGS